MLPSSIVVTYPSGDVKAKPLAGIATPAFEHEGSDACRT
jgi:hypothetical protein